MSWSFLVHLVPQSRPWQSNLRLLPYRRTIRCFSSVRHQHNDKFYSLTVYQTCKTWPALPRYIQSFVRPSTIEPALISRWRILGSKNLADASLDFVHYLNIFTLPDLLIFLHNLPMFLETHTSVNRFTNIYGFPLTEFSDFPDSPHYTKFDLVPFSNLSGFDNVQAGNITYTRKASSSQDMLLA